MILHSELASRCCLVENATKINELGSERNRTDSEDAEQTELDGKDLVCTSHLDRDSHSELLIFVLGRLLVLLDEEAATSLQNASIRLELAHISNEPYP